MGVPFTTFDDRSGGWTNQLRFGSPSISVLDSGILMKLAVGVGLVELYRTLSHLRYNAGVHLTRNFHYFTTAALRLCLKPPPQGLKAAASGVDEARPDRRPGHIRRGFTP